MTAGETIRAIDGSDLKIQAESVCVHGDSPGAVAMAVAVKTALETPESASQPLPSQHPPPATQQRTAEFRI